MRKNYFQYSWLQFKNFGEAIINLFIFLPYFFSVSTLLKTLFSPWKNLVVNKKSKGFSFEEFTNRFFFNLISRSIGLIMRLTIISFYFLLQTVLMIFLPFYSLIFFILTPIRYIIYLYKKTPDEKKQILKDAFIKTHILDSKNIHEGEVWFDHYYHQFIHKTNWWYLSNLLQIPPLCRDWAVGYTPILDQYAYDMGNSQYLSHIKNIVDREKEIKQIEDVLSKSTEANVLVVGDEGVGKHTIIDALAKKIYLGQTHPHLMYRRILKVNMEKILNEYSNNNQQENFFEELLIEASQANNVILFIDNFDKYFSSDHRSNLSIALEKYSKTDRLQIIGTTTPYAYEQKIFTNDKIQRLFTKIDVYEVNINEAKKILMNAIFDLEKYHQVSIPYETIIETINKCQFYITHIPFPEKAIDLLDNVSTNHLGQTITPDHINQTLTHKIHIPTTISTNMKNKLLNLETLLYSKIVQQDLAIKKLSVALRRSFLLIGKRKKPLASFLFLGPTGVGKTETAKAIAKTFFERSSQENQSEKTSVDYLIRFDMANFQQKSDIDKLLGDSANNQSGLLTKAIHQQNYGVLLLDEFEKAHKDLLNIFLTIIDEGYFVNNFGKKVDCKNLIIIATSNAGADRFYNHQDNTDIIDYLVNQNIFTPELINRFDDVIVYSYLTKESLHIIAQKIIARLTKNIYDLYQIKLVITDKTVENIIKEINDTKFGARLLERKIHNQIEDKISKIILEERVINQQIIL